MADTSSRLEKIHAQSKKDFETALEAVREERQQCLQDRRFCFIAGAAWEGSLGDQFENKPRLEVNKISGSVSKIVSEYLQNLIDVTFKSRDGREADALADTCAMLYRADMIDSAADEAHDTAFLEAVSGGFGAWRLRADYDDEDGDTEYQRIRIEPITDADSTVFFDIDAKRQDKADATKCWVVTSMSREAYELEWGDDVDSWPDTVSNKSFDWATPDTVRVVEYYVVERRKETLITYRGLDGSEYEALESDVGEDMLETLAATGFSEVARRKRGGRRVHKYIMSGCRVLEDAGYIAGKHIPIVPVYGKRLVIDGVERCSGHVRNSKDVQRLKNMQISKLAEIAAVSSVEKPIFLAEQVAGHQQMWADDPIKNYPYALINPVIDTDGRKVQSGPVDYTRPPAVPPAMVALLQITESDMQEMLGNQQAGEKIVSNISGQAIEMIQGRLDMHSYTYISNFSKAIKRSGEIWLSMAKDVFVESGRRMKGIGVDGKSSSIELMRPIVTESGEIEYENDLSSVAFDVSVDVGPSSDSRRKAVVRSLTDMMRVTSDPETMQVLGAMAMMNMDGEGLEDAREFFRKKLLLLGAVKPTDEEAQDLMRDMQGKSADPQAAFLNASAVQAMASADKSRADTVLTIAKAEKTRADTLETMRDIDREARQSLLGSLSVPAIPKYDT